MLLLFPGTFLLCKVNNKHMHRGHFDDPDGAQRSCRSEGWTCEDCSQYVTGSCFLWGVSPRPSPPVTVQSCPGVPVQMCVKVGDIASFAGEEHSIILGSTKGTDDRGKKCYKPLTSADPIAKDT